MIYRPAIQGILPLGQQDPLQEALAPGDLPELHELVGTLITGLDNPGAGRIKPVHRELNVRSARFRSWKVSGTAWPDDPEILGTEAALFMAVLLATRRQQAFTINRAAVPVPKSSDNTSTR